MRVYWRNYICRDVLMQRGCILILTNLLLFCCCFLRNINLLELKKCRRKGYLIDLSIDFSYEVSVQLLFRREKEEKY